MYPLKTINANSSWGFCVANDTLYGVHMLFNGGPSRLGDGYSAQSLKNYIDEAIKLGSDVIRFPGDWNALEPAPGQWNTSYINNVRSAIQYAEDQGVKVVMLFAQTPEWARPNPSDSIWHPPEDAGDFADAMAYFYNQLSSVRDNILAWEVWNEPNVFEFWGSANPATDVRQVDGQDAFVLVKTRFASEYVELLNAAYTALHNAANAANTDVTVLGGSTAGTDFQYVQAMIAAGAQFDGLAVHPYTRVNDTSGDPGYGMPWAPDATLAQFNASARPTLNKLWSFEYGMNRLRNLVSQDVWITEFGWTIGNGWGDVSPNARVQYMETALELIRGWNDVPVATAYRLFDDGAGNFGLLNNNGSIRDSGLVLQEYADGGGGSNVIQGTSGNDELFGTDGDDIFEAQAGSDILRGRDGNDFYLGGSGSDRFVFTAGEDFVGDFNLSADRVILLDLGVSSFAQVQPLLQQWGPNAAIVFDADTSIVLENINIGDLSATHFGFSDPGTIVGTAQNDTLTGTSGADTIQGLGGRDLLKGLAGADDLDGGNGNDRLFGHNGADDLDGGDGNDRLFGNNHADTLKGGNGNDILWGGAEGDDLNGGSGNDRASYTTAPSAVRADLGDESSNTGEAAGDTYTSIEQLQGSKYNDTLLGNSAANRLWGHNGNDELHGSGGNDRVYGQNGNDLLFGDGGADRLDGGAGNDFLLGGGGNDRFIFVGNFGEDFVGDFTQGDKVLLKNTGVSSFAQLQGLMSEFGGNTFITFNGQKEIVLEGVAVASLSASDFIFI